MPSSLFWTQGENSRYTKAMKTFTTWLLVGFFLTPLGALASDDVKVAMTRRKLESSKERSGVNKSVEAKTIAYDIQITSRSFKEYKDVVVKYMIFYEDAQLGSTSKPEIKIGSGSQVFPSVLNNKPLVFVTNPIELEKASLDGNYFFGSGASSQVKDRVVGLWVRVFDSAGGQIGSYFNPTTVPKKFEWKE